MPYNLTSPSGILEPCDLRNPSAWFTRELEQIPNSHEKNILHSVAASLDTFICWPVSPILLWPGCDRVPPKGKKTKYHCYQKHIKEMARSKNITLDGRANGPAIAAYLIAGGARPKRFGSSNRWSVHHLYSGKFPYIDRTATMHAARHANHFTQSAGLIAAHPIADALADEFPFFAWLLRVHSFNKFGYDPDGVFSSCQNSYGFKDGSTCTVLSENC